jgi:hypothetical protein
MGKNRRRPNSGSYLHTDHSSRRSGVDPVIFVSHAADDADTVAQLVKALRGAFPRATVFFSSSPESLRPGDVWWDQIRVMLDRAAIVLACVSRWSLMRPWIMFEAGAALGRNRAVVPVIMDDLPLSGLIPPLSMFQAVRFSEHDLPALLDHVSREIGIPPQITEAASTFVHPSPSVVHAPGIYSGTLHMGLQSGWVPYTGNPASLEAHRESVRIGNSYNDGFRFPPVDSLTAPWRIFGFRFRYVDEVYIYPVLKLVDGSTRKIIASTAISTWGFTASPRDEYRIPLGALPKNRWLVAWIDVVSLEPDFPAPVQHLIGIRARGPLWLSHVWCVNSPDEIPAEYRKHGRELRYPR